MIAWTHSDGAGEFSEGLAIVKIDYDYGFINKDGEIVINPQFDGAGNFSEGLSGVVIGDEFGFINKDGEIVINPQFDHYYFYNLEWQ